MSDDMRKKKYGDQKTSAKNRGIVWEFTFDTWWDTWDKSGKWDQRGCRRGQYVMARLGPDLGPYSAHNVVIQQMEKNVSDGRLGKSILKGVSKTAEHKRKISATITQWHKTRRENV